MFLTSPLIEQRFHSMIGVLGITAPFCLLACRRLFSSGPVNSAPPSPRSLGTILWDFQFTRRSTRSTSLLTGSPRLGVTLATRSSLYVWNEGK
jgi:hypothetical protein